MEKRGKLGQLLIGVALITLLILMVPLIGMQFTSEINWSTTDFIIMGALIFVTGTVVMLIIRLKDNLIYRLAFVLAIGASFFMVWVNLAVGLIGSGPNAGNLMYIGVLIVFILGVYLSRFKVSGLERAMFLTALALILLMAIALLLRMDRYPDSSSFEIVAINLFFAAPYIVSGLLFRFVAKNSSSVTR